MTRRTDRHDDDPMALERRTVRRHFGGASTSYDRAASLQTQVRHELMERAKLLFRPESSRPLTILDLGCGTGAALSELRAHWPQARLLAVDAAWPMLTVAQTQSQPASSGMLGRLRSAWRQARPPELVCADAGALPLADGSVDLVFSNLMLQWCDPIDDAAREIARVLRPGGVLTISTFGPDTLRELRMAWAQVDPHPHVSRFLDMHDVGDALARHGLREPVLDVDLLHTEHTDVRALMRHLKDIGARNASGGRNHALTGRARFAAMCAAYPREAGHSGIGATWEVIYASAFGAGPRRDAFTVDVAELTNSLRRRRDSAGSDAEP